MQCVILEENKMKWEELLLKRKEHGEAREIRLQLFGSSLFSEENYKKDCEMINARALNCFFIETFLTSMLLKQESIGKTLTTSNVNYDGAQEGSFLIHSLC